MNGSQTGIDVSYQVVFKGELREGWSKDKACSILHHKLNIPKKKCLSIFKKPTKIKRHLRYEQAVELAKKFFTCGLKVEIEKMDFDINSIDFRSIFANKIKPRKPSFYYIVGLFASLIAVLLMPLIYLGVISAVILFLVNYIQGLFEHGLYLSDLKNIFGLFFVMLKWVIPPLMSFSILFFLLKPLFASRNKERATFISKEDNPKLYELIESLSFSIGCPMPAKIMCNSDANASVSFVRGVHGIFKKQIQLTIGMPLVNGLDAKMFVGVLAHELGHFSQRYGMIVSYLINAVNGWLYSRAYEPDAIDSKISEWFDESDNGFMNIIYASMLTGIGLIRSLMSILFSINLYFSAYFSRQMEYDADSYEALISGSHNFKATSFQLRKLYYSRHEIDYLAAASYDREYKVFSDIPEATKRLSELIDKVALKEIKKNMEQQQTMFWDSHPADNERIEKAEQLKHPGLFLESFPARLLVDSYQKLNNKVSFNFYSYEALLLDPKECMSDFDEVMKALA